MTTVLEARGLVKHHDEVRVLDGVDLRVDAGLVTVVVGPNGAGKTTLFNCLSGSDRVDGGSVWHRGRDVTDMAADARARGGLARTFQRSAVFPTLTVAENLLVAQENRARRGLLRGVLGVQDPRRHRQQADVRAVLAEVGLSRLADVRAGALPSGTMHLVELARALCLAPDTLMLDEPASGLDDRETEHLHQLLRRLAARGLAVLMIEHDLLLVGETADVVHVMADGRVVVSGGSRDVLDRADVRELLFGRPL